jgi:tetratricopeptide (TPR) repeat protein
MANKKQRVKKSNPSQAPGEKKNKKPGIKVLKWILALVATTTICFLPMLKNGFTNWDDEFYVINNQLLRGPDWVSIFNTPVVSNYHPLTIISLAINFAISGTDPSSYIIFNLLLHLANTVLVYYFILQISSGKNYVAVFTALIFGIHPMHVESVAWISERKDLLYTLFLLLSLIQYWRFLQKEKKSKLILCFLFFSLSLLSKPAAIILPLLLLLLDYWLGRAFHRKVIIEKVPFLLLALIFAIITLKIQSRSAITGLDFYPLWTRFFFANYVSVVYLIRFIIPYPLSAFHPFPSAGNLGLPVLLSPLLMLILITIIWLKRKDKLFIFSFLFYLINILLVLQVVTIGAALVAERYTYVPYIGVAFFAAVLIDRYVNKYRKKWVWLLAGSLSFIFCFLTFQRVKVWENSGTLWSDVLKHYENAVVARNNRANYLIRQASLPEMTSKQNEILVNAWEDCNVSIKIKPNHPKAYEYRQNIFIRLGKDSAALADANTLIALEPSNHMGYYTKGKFYFRSNRPDSSKYFFDKCLAINPDVDYALNNRGCLFFNNFNQYEEALADLNRAIELNPMGEYFLNRSKCYYQLGNVAMAQNDALKAMEMGEVIPADYRSLLQFR